MRRTLLPSLTALALAACVGPTPHTPEVPVPAAWRPPSASEDSTRWFYDSLRAARPDSIAAMGAPAPTGPAYPAPTMDSAAVAGIVSWFDLLQDTTLHRLIDVAVRENKDVLSALATIREFRARVGVARSEWFPQLYANGQLGTNRVVFGASAVPAEFDVWRVTADLSWELDFWGRIRRSTQAAQADLVSREEDQRAVILSLVSDVATAYLQLREFDRNLEIARRTLASRKETYRLALERFRQGVISELDVKQFESEVAAPAAQVASFERAILQKENELSILLGRNPAAVPRGRALTEVVAPTAIPATLPSTLLERRPDVRRAERQFASATYRIGAAQAVRLPKFTITGSYGTQSPDPDNLFTSDREVYGIFGGISLPLFTGGRLVKEVEAARARAEQARIAYERTVLVAFREVNDALAAVRTARDQLAATAQQVSALRRAERLSTLRYENGISSYLEVLDAQRNLFAAELNQTAAERFLSVSAVQLYKALGGGWPTDAPAVGDVGTTPYQERK